MGLVDPADVVVIGGGVIGLSCAHALALRGVNVVVIERDGIGSGSSSENAGHIVPSHVIPFAAPGMVGLGLRDLRSRHGAFGLSRSAGLRLLPWLAAFARNCTADNVSRGVPALRDLGALSVATLEDWTAREGWTTRLHRNGLLQVFRTDAGLAAAQIEADHLRQHGVAADILTADDVASREPGLLPGSVGAVHLRDDASLDPKALLFDLAAAVRHLGGRVLSPAHVTGINRREGGEHSALSIDLDCDGVPDRIEAAQVVIAAGVWSRHVARMVGARSRIPLMPARGYSTTLGMREQPAFHHPMILGEAHVAITPMNRQVRITGRYELAGTQRSIDERRTRALMAAAREYVKLPATMHIDSRWTGLRPATVDGMPMIGRLRSTPEVILATGHGMLGTSLGAGTGELVARVITGEDPGMDATPMAPDRF
jgi:D-amino-acid dehydrogenase